MTLTVNETGVYLDGNEIPNCTQVDLKRISPVGCMEVVLHVEVNKADVKWAVKE